MNKIVLKLTTAVSTAALLTGSVASVAFGTTTVTVTGNGADSHNTANVDVSNSTAVSQTNNADIQNTVYINANSGNNTANKNTGGDTSISTGDANVSSSVSNSANSNVASIGCACPSGVDVKIAGNGADSNNKVDADVTNGTALSQTNNAQVTNKVDIDAKSGKNEANKNTGGETSIETGDVDVTSDVSNSVNQNVAQIGGGSGSGSSFSAEISGNGADSRNKIDLDIDSAVAVSQTNNADIKNSVDVDANSGKNEANKNTGGDTSIDTGDADVEVGITNMANSNVLDLSSCDCVIDGSVKVAGNGADSKNKAEVTLGSALAASQTNNFQCDGEKRGGNCAGVDVDSSTGHNEADKNTVHGSDPVVETGDAGADVTVSTSVNKNVLGNIGGELTFPDLSNVHDFNGLMVLLMGMFSSH